MCWSFVYDAHINEREKNCITTRACHSLWCETQRTTFRAATYVLIINNIHMHDATLDLLVHTYLCPQTHTYWTNGKEFLWTKNVNMSLKRENEICLSPFHITAHTNIKPHSKNPISVTNMKHFRFFFFARQFFGHSA